MTPGILVVEDDKAAALAVGEVLAALGARVVTAYSGEDALRCVLKERFAAILLDVRLPGMDGYEVAAAIRTLERSRRTPILFMSAEDDRRRRPRSGAPREDFLRKPLSAELLRRKVAALLEPTEAPA